MYPSDGNRSLGKAFRPSAHGENPMDARFLHPAALEERKRRAAKYAKEVEEHGRFAWQPKMGDG